MKTIIKNLKGLLWPSKTKRMKTTIYSSELFWATHPNSYVSMYMKHDWFKMERVPFIARYIKEYFESNLPEKQNAILSVVGPMWDDLSTEEKYLVSHRLISPFTAHADSFNLLLRLHELFGCGFLEKAVKASYKKMTGRDWDADVIKDNGGGCRKPVRE